MKKKQESMMKHKHVLLERLAVTFAPRPRMTPSEWGAAYRIYPPHAPVPGPRDPRLTPYMTPWTEAIAAGLHRRVVFACGAQMGKTDGMLDVMGERLDNNPAPIIYVGPTKEFCIDQFEPRVMRLFEESPTLNAKVAYGKRMKKTRKLVADVPVRLAHAGSSTALKSDPAALALVDEYDGMVQNIHGQGDPLGLVEARGFTYANFVTAISSTPTHGAIDVEKNEESGLIFWKRVSAEDVQSPIWRLWQQGTRHHWAWPCPHCDEYFIPRFACLRWTGITPADARKTAYIACPRCEAHILEEDKEILNAGGRMVAPGQRVSGDGVVSGDPPDSSTISFWVSGLCSPFRSFGERAHNYVSATQSGVVGEVQTVMNSRFGECFINVAGDAPAWAEVAARRQEYERGTVPSEVIHLVLTADVQKNRIEWVLRGWGARKTSWLINFGKLWGETHDADVWDDLADLIKEPVEGRQIKRVFVDSGFRPGKKDIVPLNRVYDFCRRFPSLVRPTKGSSHSMRTPLLKAPIEVNRKGEGAKYGLMLYRLDTSVFKSEVHERVRRPDGQPGAWYLPAMSDHECEDYCRQIVSECRVNLPSGRLQWTQISKENHYLDCEAMQCAAAYSLNAERWSLRDKSTAAPPPQPQVTTQNEQIRRPGLASKMAGYGGQSPRRSSLVPEWQRKKE